MPELSVVTPCYNEAENLRPLRAAISAALDPLGSDFAELRYEIAESLNNQ